MKKFFILTTIMIFLITELLFKVDAKVSVGNLTIGNINNARLGSHVTFGGKTWRLIDDNYIMLQESIGISPISKNVCNNYIDSDIRKYLNNQFADKLGFDKNLLTDVEWGIGDQRFEDNITVKDKISIPSYSDMKIAKQFIAKSQSNVWTRTSVQSEGNQYKGWSMNTKDNSLVQQDIEKPALVYPVAYIYPNVLVQGYGTKENPYMILQTHDKNDKTIIKSFDFNSKRIYLKKDEKYDLIPLVTFGDDTVRQVVSVQKYLGDKDLSSTISRLPYKVLVTGDKITYTSSNSRIAEVNDLGVITAKEQGVAVITVKRCGWTAKCRIIIN